jgi:hypothetical protein
MELVLTRKWLTDRSTIGELAVNGKFESYILEDHFPIPYVKVPGQTCIPLGRYEVIINHSQRFGMDMPLLLNVPGFEGVRIHPGNKADDTEGCLLPGQSRGVDVVNSSRAAFNILFPKIKSALAKGETVHITVEVAP